MKGNELPALTARSSIALIAVFSALAWYGIIEGCIALARVIL